MLSSAYCLLTPLIDVLSRSKKHSLMLVSKPPSRLPHGRRAMLAAAHAARASRASRRESRKYTTRYYDHYIHFDLAIHAP